MNHRKLKYDHSINFSDRLGMYSSWVKDLVEARKQVYEIQRIIFSL